MGADPNRAKFRVDEARLWTRQSRAEDGDTLIEVLVALVVLGLTAIALLTAFATSISASDEHRGLATMDTVLKSYVEAAIYQLQTQPNPGYSSSCANANGTFYTSEVAYTPPSVSGGTYTTKIDSTGSNAVEFWSSSSGFSSANPCPSPNIGPQLLTAEAKFTSSGQGTNFDETLQFVISDPTTVTPQVICSPCSASKTAGQSFNIPLTATGGPLPTLTMTGNPATTSLVNNGNGSWTLTGTVDTAATSTITITATNDVTTSTTTFTLTINPAPAYKLVFTTPPAGGQEGSLLSTQPKVTVEDQFGNVETTDAGNVSLGITGYSAGNGGTTQGLLSCTANPATASAGIATFAGCKITGTAGAGTYTLSATRTGLNPATASITVTAAAASKLLFTTTPVGGTEGAAFSTQPKVTVEDSFGNVVTSDTGSVTLSISGYVAGNGGTTQGTLGCTANPATASAGIATFAGCKITGTAGAGTYTLMAARTGLTSATASISETAGAGASLTIANIGSQTHNVAFSVQVTILDASGNVATGDTSSVNLIISQGSGTLTCSSNPVSAVAGVASFSCKISATGNHKLKASDATDGNINVTSNQFSVS